MPCSNNKPGRSPNRITRLTALVLILLVGTVGCLSNPDCRATDVVCHPENLQLYAAQTLIAGNTRFVLKYGYVGLGSTNLIGQFTVDHATGTLTANSPATVTSGNTTRFLAAHPSGRFLYGLSQTGASVHQFAVDQATGQLSALSPASVATSAASPFAISVHPNGKFAYVGVSSSASIDMFLVDEVTGTFTANSPATLAGCNAQTFAYHPTQDFVFAVCSNTSQVHTYSVSGNGTLTQLSTSVTVGTQVKGLAITPDGGTIYATAQASGWVRMFSVNQSTGALTSLGTVTTDQWPNEIVVEASGRYAYGNCWNSSAETVRMFAIDSAGLLTDLAPNAIPTGGAQPLYLAAEPTGRFVYVSNAAANTLNTYSIDADTGQLASQGLTATGSGPRGMVFIGFEE